MFSFYGSHGTGFPIILFLLLCSPYMDLMVQGSQLLCSCCCVLLILQSPSVCLYDLQYFLLVLLTCKQCSPFIVFLLWLCLAMFLFSFISFALFAMFHILLQYFHKLNIHCDAAMIYGGLHMYILPWFRLGTKPSAYP